MIENFGDKRNTNGFDKRPEDTKKGGRKKSNFKSIVNSFKEEGFEPVTKEDYSALVAMFLNLPQRELDKLETLEDTPLFVKNFISGLKNKSYKYKMLAHIRDWHFGKVGFDPNSKPENSFLIKQSKAIERYNRLMARAIKDKEERDSLAK